MKAPWILVLILSHSYLVPSTHGLPFWKDLRKPPSLKGVPRRGNTEPPPHFPGDPYSPQPLKPPGEGGLPSPQQGKHLDLDAIISTQRNILDNPAISATQKADALKLAHQGFQNEFLLYAAALQEGNQAEAALTWGELNDWIDLLAEEAAVINNPLNSEVEQFTVASVAYAQLQDIAQDNSLTANIRQVADQKVATFSQAMTSQKRLALERGIPKDFGDLPDSGSSSSRNPVFPGFHANLPALKHHELPKDFALPPETHGSFQGFPPLKPTTVPAPFPSVKTPFQLHTEVARRKFLKGVPLHLSDERTLTELLSKMDYELPHKEGTYNGFFTQSLWDMERALPVDPALAISKTQNLAMSGKDPFLFETLLFDAIILQRIEHNPYYQNTLHLVRSDLEKIILPMVWDDAEVRAFVDALLHKENELQSRFKGAAGPQTSSHTSRTPQVLPQHSGPRKVRASKDKGHLEPKIPTGGTKKPAGPSPGNPFVTPKPNFPSPSSGKTTPPFGSRTPTPLPTPPGGGRGTVKTTPFGERLPLPPHPGGVREVPAASPLWYLDLERFNQHSRAVAAFMESPRRTPQQFVAAFPPQQAPYRVSFPPSESSTHSSPEHPHHPNSPPIK